MGRFKDARIVNIRSTGWGDYRIPAPDGREASACYTDDKEDAIGTAHAMWKGINHLIKINGKLIPTMLSMI
jgi:hypothetical protein